MINLSYMICYSVTTSDVVNLYQTEVKRINAVVKRKSNSFPEEFCFQLNNEEYLIIKKEISLRLHFATLENTISGGENSLSIYHMFLKDKHMMHTH